MLRGNVSKPFPDDDLRSALLFATVFGFQFAGFQCLRRQSTTYLPVIANKPERVLFDNSSTRAVGRGSRV